MKKLTMLVAAACMVAAMVLASAGTSSGQELLKAKRSFFIDGPKRERFARTSIAIRGRKITSGFVVKYPRGCDGGRKRSAFLIDFSGSKFNKRDHFKDVDSLPGGKSVARGKRDGDSIAGRAYGWTRLSDGSYCHFGTTFDLKPVSHARWKQYSARARDWDATFPGDG